MNDKLSALIYLHYMNGCAAEKIGNSEEMEVQFSAAVEAAKTQDFKVLSEECFRYLMDCIIDWSYLYSEANMLEKTAEILQYAKQVLTRNTEYLYTHHNLLVAFRTLANMYNIAEKTEEAEQLLMFSLNYYKRANDIHATIITMEDLGNLAFLNNDFEKALKYLEQTIVYWQQRFEEEANEDNAYDLMTSTLPTVKAFMCSTDPDRMKEAKALLEKALQVCERLKNTKYEFQMRKYQALYSKMHSEIFGE